MILRKMNVKDWFKNQCRFVPADCFLKFKRIRFIKCRKCCFHQYKKIDWCGEKKNERK